MARRRRPPAWQRDMTPGTSTPKGNDATPGGSRQSPAGPAPGPAGAHGYHNIAFVLTNKSTHLCL